MAQDNSENQEKIKAMQAMFFNEQLQLTPEEAKKFRLCYTEYQDKIKKVNQQMRNLNRITPVPTKNWQRKINWKNKNFLFLKNIKTCLKKCFP